MSDLNSVYYIWKCSCIAIHFQIFIYACMANTFEIMFTCSCWCIHFLKLKITSATWQKLKWLLIITERMYLKIRETYGKEFYLFKGSVSLLLLSLCRQCFLVWLTWAEKYLCPPDSNPTNMLTSSAGMLGILVSYTLSKASKKNQIVAQVVMFCTVIAQHSWQGLMVNGSHRHPSNSVIC